LIALVALISPYREDRARARAIAAPRFLEVFIQTSLETCERRDPKGLYRKARSGAISEFTGVSAPYEPPLSADVVLDCETVEPNASTRVLLDRLAALELVNLDMRRHASGPSL
jgi:adenylylsulfate kinase